VVRGTDAEGYFMGSEEGGRVTISAEVLGGRSMFFCCVVEEANTQYSLN
jgi:hypothetical protein